MDFGFNLVDRTWVPCIGKDGRLVSLGLRDVLARAHELLELRDDSPLGTIALHRLLLAVIHRVFGPRALDDWRRMWETGCFDAKALDAYWNLWRSRFDLCDKKHPFFQRAAVDSDNQVPITRLALVAGNNATLFDHRYEEEQLALPPEQAARLLVAYQCFAIGGGVSKPFNLCHSPLIAQGGYLSLATGKSLFETLCLNALCYGPDKPMPSAPDDCPSWELETPKTPVKTGTVPNGYLDYLTWQSRQIQLISEKVDGQLGFRTMYMVQGLRLSDSFGSSEPMAAYVKGKDDQYRAKDFQESRALWRDSQVLFESIEGSRKAPRVLEQLALLKQRGMLPTDATFGLAAFGISTDKAKVHFWRREDMPLPLAVLGNKELLDRLGDALKCCEDAASALGRAAWRLAEIISTIEQSGKPDKDRTSQMASKFDPRPRFWSRIEMLFRRMLQDLPGDATHQAECIVQWRKGICRVAGDAFSQVLATLDNSPRTLRAVYTGDWGAKKVCDVELAKILAAGQV